MREILSCNIGVWIELWEDALTVLRTHLTLHRVPCLILGILSKEEYGEFGKNSDESHKSFKKKRCETNLKERGLFTLENLENLRVFWSMKSYNLLKSVWVFDTSGWARHTCLRDLVAEITATYSFKPEAIKPLHLKGVQSFIVHN